MDYTTFHPNMDDSPFLGDDSIPDYAFGNYGNQSQEDYDYAMYLDYMATVDSTHIPTIQLVPVSIAYGMTFLLGLVGNTLVIFTILRYRRMQSVTNVFLLSLSTADILVVLICVPIKVCVGLFFHRILKLIDFTIVCIQGPLFLIINYATAKVG